MKYATLVLTLLTFSGCATSDKAFRQNVQSLIDCEYRYTNQDLTCKEIYDLQLDCYSLYKMRGFK